MKNFPRKCVEHFIILAHNSDKNNFENLEILYFTRTLKGVLQEIWEGGYNSLDGGIEQNWEKNLSLK
jgi:hypothetical protein